MSAPAANFLSVVIPVYNEELNLPMLFSRLYPVLDGLGRRYEVIFTNDGSHDRSIELLKAQHAARPDVTRVINFNANYGQHMAIMSGLTKSSEFEVRSVKRTSPNFPSSAAAMLPLTMLCRSGWARCAASTARR